GAAAGRVDGEVEDVQLGLVQLVDHEADHLLALLGHHADAVALAQAAQEVFLGPRVLEAILLGLQDFRHVPADHPADVDPNLIQLLTAGTHPPLLFSPRDGAQGPLRGYPNPYVTAVEVPMWTGSAVAEGPGRRPSGPAGGLVTTPNAAES